MRWLALLLCVSGGAQTFVVAPRLVKQGETIRVRAMESAAAARMNGREVRLFPQSEGGWLGLMPVSALEMPGAYKLEILASGGATLFATTIAVRNARFPKQNVVLGKEVAELQPSPGEMEAVSAFRKAVSETRRWREPFDEPVLGCVVSLFGLRRYHNGKATGNYHAGLDQRAPAGAPVHAIAAGTVEIVRQFNIHGGTVAIDHGQGVSSMYLHLSRFAATEGAAVARGDVIGFVGSTGRSSAPHLHWSLYVNGVPVNPRQWLALKPCRPAPPRAARPKPPARLAPGN